MYEVFDSFIENEWWHTCHAEDERRFFVALHKVVRDTRFSPEEMGDYLRSKLKQPYNRDVNPFEQAVRHYVSAAWAVRDFLITIGEADASP